MRLMGSGAGYTDMNAKLIFRTLFLIVILLLLVMMGLNNKQTVSFALPPLLSRPLTQPAALMYFTCFAVGLLTGTVLTAGGGGGGRGGAGKSSKSSEK